MTTFAPSSTRAAARWPGRCRWPPPVTTATRSVRRPAMDLSVGRSTCAMRRASSPSVAMKTFFTSVNASSASGPSSRPEPGLLEPAERRPVAHRGVRVHRQVAGLDAARDPQRPADVAGPDRAGQAVLGVVGHRDRVGLVVERQHRDDRAEDLLAPDPVGAVDAAATHGRREPEARARRARCRGRRRPPARRRPRRTRARRPAGSAEISGPISRRPRRGGSTTHALDGGLEQLQEPVVRPSAATRIRERAQQSWPALSKTPYGAVGRRLLEVGVGEDDVGALAAELEGDPLHLVGAAGHDPLADLGRAGEHDLAHAAGG